jgi:hypothetical protein
MLCDKLAIFSSRVGNFTEIHTVSLHRALVKSQTAVEELQAALLALPVERERSLTVWELLDLPPQPLECFISPFSVARRHVDIEDAQERVCLVFLTRRFPMLCPR